MQRMVERANLAVYGESLGQSCKTTCLLLRGIGIDGITGLARDTIRQRFGTTKMDTAIGNAATYVWYRDIDK